MIIDHTRPHPGQAVLARCGGFLALAGTWLPWIAVEAIGGATTQQRGNATTLGSIMSGLAIMTIVATLVHRSVRRIGVAVLSLAGCFWGAVWLFWYDAHAHLLINAHAAMHVRLGVGWYLAMVGFGVALLVSMVTPLWHLGARWHTANRHA